MQNGKAIYREAYYMSLKSWRTIGRLSPSKIRTEGTAALLKTLKSFLKESCEILSFGAFFISFKLICTLTQK